MRRKGGINGPKAIAAIVAGLLALTLIAMPGGLVFATDDAAALCKGGTAKPRQISKRVARKAVLCLVNKQRTKRGLGKLRRSSSADEAAVKHTKVMVSKGCFAHQCPGEGDLVSRLISSDYLPCACSWGAGENIAWGLDRRGSAREIVEAWMKSSGHRANILDRSFEKIGVGLAWGSPYDRKARAATYTTVFGFRN